MWRVNSSLCWFLNQILPTTSYYLSCHQWKLTPQLDSPPWPLSELWSGSVFPLIPPDWGRRASTYRHWAHYTRLCPVMSHVIANSVSTLTFKSNSHPWHAVPATLFLPLEQSFATHRPLKLSYYLATPSCLPYCHISSDRELPTSSGKNFVMLHFTSSSSPAKRRPSDF